MASTTSTPSTFLSSPRTQRMMLWISGAVLVVGLAIFLGVVFGRGTAQDVHTGGNTNVQTGPGDRIQPASAQKVPASPAARRVARTFLETAVARKHLALAYAITGPILKGIPRAQWIKGSNPVVYFPAANLKTAPLKVTSSTKNELSLEVGPLVAPKGTKIGGRRSLAFKMDVDRIGGKWLVNYFIADYSPGSLQGQQAGLGN